MNSIITLQQLPIITFEKIKEVSEQVQKRIADLDLENQIITEQTVKSVKDTRAELNKEFKKFEEQRKYIKEQIAKPYQEFEEQYKTFIAKHYNETDETLKNKIYAFEIKLKTDKENEVKDYFNELCQSKNINFIAFSRLGLNVTISSSLKSLKEQVKSFLEGVEKDIDLAKNIPESETYRNEVLFEYKKSLDINNALRLVAERDKARQETQKQAIIKQEQQQKQEATQENTPPQQTPITQPLKAPVVEQVEEIYQMTFTVKGTIDQLKALKQFLVNNNIEILN